MGLTRNGYAVDGVVQEQLAWDDIIPEMTCRTDMFKEKLERT